jgi:serine/threonine-protein kinase HipA
MATALAIWLNQLHVAVVERDRKGRLRLYYTDAAHDAFERGTPVLSLNLPLTTERYPNARNKYQEDAGPSLAAIARVLQGVARNEDTETFLRALTLNVAIGNCDAHAKNFSLLHTESGALRLAPLYDLMSTRLYPVDDKLAMYVDTVQEADRVTSERVVNEATSWGLRRQLAEDVVGDVLARIPQAAASAADEAADVPAKLVQLVLNRTKRLAAGQGAAEA